MQYITKVREKAEATPTKEKERAKESPPTKAKVRRDPLRKESLHRLRTAKVSLRTTVEKAESLQKTESVATAVSQDT